MAFRRRSKETLTTVGFVDLLGPTVHPHIGEPLISKAGFSIELWTDWLIPASDVDRYRRAAVAMSPLDRTKGHTTMRGLVTVERTVLWVSVIATGQGPAGDEVWALAEGRFRELWFAVHERARLDG
jgi:hypothetical protein